VTPVERRFSPAMVVIVWGIANALLAAVLAGFTVVRSAGLLVVDLYCASLGLVFLLGLLVWLVRRRRPYARGLRLPARPAAALLLAAGVALIWLGLPFGAWLPMIAVIPLTVALILEVTAGRARHDH
jgi:hypothetical protein